MKNLEALLTMNKMQPPTDTQKETLGQLPKNIQPYNIGEEQVGGTTSVTSNAGVNPDYAGDFLKLVQADNSLADQQIKAQNQLMAEQQQGLQNQQQQQEIAQQQETQQKQQVAQMVTDANKGTLVDNTDMVQNLIKGFQESMTPFRGDTAETTPFFDILRAAAASYAPQQSALFESDIKGRQGQIKVQQDLLAKLTKEKTRLVEREQDQLIDEKTAEGKITGARAKLIRERADKFDKMPSFKAVSEGLREVNNAVNLIKSGSKFSYNTLINQLIRLSGDKRINEADRKAFSSSLGIKDGMTQKAMQKIIGGKLTGATKEEAMKLINSATASMTKNVNNLIEGERKLLELDGTLDTQDINELISTLRSRYGLKQQTGGQQVGRFVVREK